MKIFLWVVGVWFLINVLFVVLMMPPIRPRKELGLSRFSPDLTRAPAEQSHHHVDEEEFSLRHTIIAVAMGVFFSLTPPLVEALDDIKRMIKKHRKSDPTSDGMRDADSRPLEENDDRRNVG